MNQQPQENLADVTIHSPQTRMQGAKAANVESRPWIERFPVCQTLKWYDIIHVGIQTAVAPTRIVRTNQTTTYFLACFGGRGRVLIDGHWRVCREGFACLLPAHTLNAPSGSSLGRTESLEAGPVRLSVLPGRICPIVGLSPLSAGGRFVAKMISDRLRCISSMVASGQPASTP